MSETPRTQQLIDFANDEGISDGGLAIALQEHAELLERELADKDKLIERLKCCTNCGSRLWAATGSGDCKNCKDFSAWTSQGEAAKTAERGK